MVIIEYPGPSQDWLLESVEILGFGSVVFELEAKIWTSQHFQKFHSALLQNHGLKGLDFSVEVKFANFL